MELINLREVVGKLERKRRVRCKYLKKLIILSLIC